MAAPGAAIAWGVVVAEMGDEAELLQRVACWIFQAVGAGNVARHAGRAAQQRGCVGNEKGNRSTVQLAKRNCCPHTVFVNVSQGGTSAVTKASAPKSSSLTL